MNRYALFFVCIFSTSALPAMAALDPSQPLSPAPPLSLFKAWAKEGANKQVISSQADSLIKISRIWADFFPANTSNQPI